MALLKRKEFAALCHTTSLIINSNVHRGKIIVGEDGNIDSDHPFNKAFFEKYIKREKKTVDNSSLYEKVVHKKKVTKKKTVKNEAKEKEHESARQSLNWDDRKKRAEALLKERQAEKALLDVKKMYGEMLPTDFVQQMFTSFSKSIFSTFDDSTMNLAGLFCDELAGGDREALSRINHKLSEELQRIINNAAKVTKKDIDNEIKEYSVKKRQGQKT